MNALQNQQISNEIAHKIFLGYVLDIPDPLKAGRSAIYIPELMASVPAGSKYIFAKNVIGSYTKTRNTFSPSKDYIDYGSYTPLYAGVRVLITFIGNNIDTDGYVIAIDSDIKQPTPSSKYNLIYKSQSGSSISVDDDTGVMHLKNNNGSSNVLLGKDSITLQLSKPDPKNGGTKKASSLILDENQLKIQFGEDTAYIFSVNGFETTLGKDTATSFAISEDGISMQGNKFLNLSSDNGKIHIYGEETFLTGYNEMHVYGSDTRITGGQKCQVSGTTVNIQGWFDTHIKAMHVGIDAYIMYNLKTLVKNSNSLAIDNKSSIIDSSATTIHSTTSSVIARASSIEARDGMLISGMGIGASMAGGVNASMIGTTLGLELAFGISGTFLLSNDPFTGIATNIINLSIAGIAQQAAGAVLSPGAVPDSIKDQVTTINDYMKNLEETSKKYIQPDNIFNN